MELEISPQLLAELERIAKVNPAQAAQMREKLALMRQAVEGVKNGQYASLEEGIKALTGNEPVRHGEHFLMKIADGDETEAADEQKGPIIRRGVDDLIQYLKENGETLGSGDISHIETIFFCAAFYLFVEITSAFRQCKTPKEFRDFMVGVEEEFEEHSKNKQEKGKFKND